MTLTRRAAAWLEKKIYSGEYPPDAPLPSTRTLAGQIQVSQRIILRALDLLEKKNILVRQARKRVFVKGRSVVDDAREILFFAFGDSIDMHGIYQAVNAMILQEGKSRKYDFFSRIISSSDELSDRRVDRELARLENVGFIDCALVYCFLDEKNMKKFLRLPYPVIFIGELPDSGRLPEGARLISPDSAGLLLTVGRYAREKSCRELALVCWERPMRHRYEKNALRSLKRFAARHGLPLRLIPLPGESIEEVRWNFESAAGDIAGRLPPGTLLAAHNIHSASFDAGELLAPKRYPDLDFITMTLPHDPCRIKYLKRDFSGLQQAIVRCIENPAGEPHYLKASFQYQVAIPETREGAEP